MEKNITHDFASVLKIMDSTSESLKTNTVNAVEELQSNMSITNGKVSNINFRLQMVEGKTGQLDDATITCYIAPKVEWFRANPTMFEEKTDAEGLTYFVPVNSSTVPEYAYDCDVDGEHRLYPGIDEHVNVERQYNAIGEDKKKYPLFSLNVALEYLRKFHSIKGDVQYRILTQYGEYDFGTTKQVVQLMDATGRSYLYIGPEQSNDQLQALPCMAKTYNGYTGSFQDNDLVKVKFVWSDDNDSGSRGIQYLAFQDSTTIFEGIGIALVRSNNVDYTTIGATYMVIQPLSGQVTFRQCVFRNVQIHSDSATPKSPIVQFSYKQGWDDSEIRKKTDDAMPEQHNIDATVDYNLDNLHYFQLPCVFVDDPPIGTTTTAPELRYINVSFISCGMGVKLQLISSYSYLVFMVRRAKPLITLNPLNFMMVQTAWNHLGKWTVFYDP